MLELSEEEAKRRVKEIVEEKKDENEITGDREEITDKIVSNLRKASPPEQERALHNRRNISRRDFLKMLGMSAGTVGLISGTSAAWGQLRASSQGLSDVDADEVDGHHLSVGSSKPGSPATGTLFYDTDGEGVHYYNGSSWVRITSSKIVDDFEDGDISEYSSSTGSYSTTTSTVKNGSYALSWDGSNGAGIYSTTGLDNYPAQGDVYKGHVYQNSGDDPKVYFGLSDFDNTYFVNVRMDDGRFVIQKRDGGNQSSIASDTSISGITGEWLEYEIDWQTDGTISATLYRADGSQMTNISGTDTTFSGGGIGWLTHSKNGGSVYFDYARLA